MMSRFILVLITTLLSVSLPSISSAAGRSAAPDNPVTGADLLREGSFLFRGRVCDEVRNHGISFAVSDPFKNHAHAVEFDRNGSFKMTVPMRGAVEEVYLYIDDIITIPVHPGDTINLETIKDDWCLSSPDPATSRDLQLARIISKHLRKKYRRLNNESNKYLMETMYGTRATAKSDSLKLKLIDLYREYTSQYAQIIDTFTASHGPLRDSLFFTMDGSNFVAGIRELYPKVNHNDSLLHYESYRKFLDSFLANRINPITNGMFSSIPKDEFRFSRIRREVSPSSLLADLADAKDMLYHTRTESPDKALSYSNHYLNVIEDSTIRGTIYASLPGIKRLCSGAKAPSLTLRDIDGKKYTLKDFRGKYLYLDFYSYYCGPCRTEFGKMEKFKTAFADVLDRVNIVTVCDDPESKEKFEEFTARHAMNDLNLIIDLEHSDPAYDITTYPTYILIDPEGKIVDFHTDRPSVITSRSRTPNPTIFEKSFRTIP